MSKCYQREKHKPSMCGMILVFFVFLSTFSSLDCKDDGISDIYESLILAKCTLYCPKMKASGLFVKYSEQTATKCSKARKA